MCLKILSYFLLRVCFAKQRWDFQTVVAETAREVFFFLWCKQWQWLKPAYERQLETSLFSLYSATHTLSARNQTWWEHLHHENQQMLQIGSPSPTPLLEMSLSKYQKWCFRAKSTAVPLCVWAEAETSGYPPASLNFILFFFSCLWVVQRKEADKMALVLLEDFGLGQLA